MGNELKALLGSWITATGTVVSAISNTPTEAVQDGIRVDLDIIGNELQASGNALEADSVTEWNLEKTGLIIQSSGNLTIVAGLLFDMNKTNELIAVFKGNLLQALGGSAALSEALDGERTLNQLLDINGQLLQVIGNSLQAIAAILELNGEDNDSLNLAGSWIQATGAVLAAISLTRSIYPPNTASASNS
ncbi:hypothetical protein LCM10_10785 [Rossellomorea aquimaris]|uniref:DUF6944 family repetitive protein n=1 Tax=Rossellomorea aquimaris TaxID=189382 RepID=UPI001CD2519C|nr:hypothetical protein [Rossellomorea aquimaris]MCA1055471.1 hypothetical protein [Rossellomorea aquimaris]